MITAVRITAGIILCAVGITGGVYSIRTARAQTIYHSVKYGRLTNAVPDMVIKACEKSYRLYPHNYDLCIQANLRLWPAISDSDRRDKDGSLELIESWCDRGLRLNFNHRTLRCTKASLISRRSASEAADYWDRFIDSQFWNSANLVDRVRFYTGAGRLAEASETVKLLKGHPGHKEASDILRKAWAAEMRIP